MDGSLVLEAQKRLEGSPLVADQFTFELRDEDGNLLQAEKNGADGKVVFEALNYTQDDIGKVYTYTISEVNDHVTGIAYDDTTVYNVPNRARIN